MTETKSAPPLVEALWLSEQQLAGADLRIVDLRWAARPPSGNEKYRAGHLPGAVFVDLDRDLARVGGPGRHPFPSAEAVSTLLGRIGVGPGTLVVAYDDAGGSISARLWFMLRAFGHHQVSLLDGGLRAWTEAGLQLTLDEPRIAPVAPQPLALDTSRVVDKARVAQLLEGRPPGVLVLDARAPERYRGEVEPIDRRKGHIPGAVNAPFSANLGAEGRFKSAAELRQLYAGLGADTATALVASCGSGVTACHDLLALELAGFTQGQLYTGSWSDWSSDPKTPIAIGPERG